MRRGWRVNPSITRQSPVNHVSLYDTVRDTIGDSIPGTNDSDSIWDSGRHDAITLTLKVPDSRHRRSRSQYRNDVYPYTLPVNRPPCQVGQLESMSDASRVNPDLGETESFQSNYPALS